MLKKVLWEDRKLYQMKNSMHKTPEMINLEINIKDIFVI